MDWKERADVFPLECKYWAGLGFGEEKKEEEEGRGRGREEGEGSQEAEEGEAGGGRREDLGVLFLSLFARQEAYNS